MGARALHKTFTRNRVMMHLRVDDDWTFADIARLFGISSSAVRDIVLREGLRPPLRTTCGLCGVPLGEPHIRFGYGRAKLVDPDDLGHGVRV